jgi:hypothetical protein
MLAGTLRSSVWSGPPKTESEHELYREIVDPSVAAPTYPQALICPTCYQVAAVVLLESRYRAIRYRTACYQILSTDSESRDFQYFRMTEALVTL